MDLERIRARAAQLESQADLLRSVCMGPSMRETDLRRAAGRFRAVADRAERDAAEVHAMAELGRQWIVTQYGVGA